jgi:hypothetical protein
MAAARALVARDTEPGVQVDSSAALLLRELIRDLSRQYALPPMVVDGQHWSSSYALKTP